MAGPLTIQRAPRGLLEYLSLKGSGQAPTELAAQLVSTIDLTNVYLQDRIITGNFATAAVGAVGDFAAAGSTVPAGELWVAFHLAVSATVNVGGSYKLRPAIFPRTGGAIAMYGPTSGSYAAGERPALGWDLPPRFLWPGDNVGLACEAVTAGTTAFNVYLYYSRLTF